MTPVASNPLADLHEAADNIFRHALKDCSIEAAFDRHLRFAGDVLLRHGSPSPSPSPIDLARFKSILVIALGKAALPMMEALLSRLPRRTGIRGICCAPEIPQERDRRVQYFAGGHPLPNQDSFDAARAALDMLGRERMHRRGKDTFIFFLISGGGSAMFELPLDPAISLEDTRAFHQALISCGATIAEINTVRKHFSAVKGGRLADAALDATMLSLLLPDVPLIHLDALASSPTLADSTTVAEAREILGRYRLLEKFPESVRRFFERKELPETSGVKSKSPDLLIGDRLVVGGRPGFEILLSSDDLVDAARKHAQSLGFEVVVDNSCDDWDYRDAARYLLEGFNALRQQHPRLCLISAGEVTVRLDGPAGAGGRNQQFALACALGLAKWEGEPLAVFSAGSDGIDGNSPGAGAMADTTTVCRARARGVDPVAALAQFNAYPLFRALGDAVVTGRTGHNLRDLRLLLSRPASDP